MATATKEQRIGDWSVAFEAVRRTLVPEQMRTMLGEMKEVEGVAQLRSYMELAGEVMASDRQAGIIAAMLVSNTKVPVSYPGEEES